MWEIKVYKRLLKIELKDWSTLSSEKTLEELEAYLQSGKDFFKIDWVIFNKFEFKKAYEKKVDSIESFLENQSKEAQGRLEIRRKEKLQKVWRWFDNVQEIVNYMKTYNLT